MKLYTAKEAGEILGISSSRVRMIAKDRNLGMQVSSKQWLFNAAQIEKMKIRKEGRPTMIPISGALLDKAIEIENQGVIDDVSDAYVVMRPRAKHRVIAEFRTPEGKKLYIVTDK